MKIYAVLPLLAVLIFACSKPDNQPSTPTPAPPPPPPEIEVDNTWRCEIGGKLYQGIIDTSFNTIVVVDAPRRDTIVNLVGSTADGKANIALKMTISRTSIQKDVVQIGTESYLTFDTASTNFLSTIPTTVFVSLKIEAFTGTKLKGTFSGNLQSINGASESVTNGAISVELGKGKVSPKFFDATISGNRTAGPLRSAVFQTNSLIIDGFSFNGDTTYRLSVRTGAAIKPGTYKSADGDVGFHMWRPSIFTHEVTDAAGNLSVTIQSVDGNIVTGTFTGSAKVAVNGGATVPMEGKFRCRVKDYVPGVDAANLWKLTMNSPAYWPNPFLTAGGNVTDAAIRQTGGRYVLTLNGTSDNGRSAFRLTMASFQPFAPGAYELSSWTDTCYIQTPAAKYSNNSSNFFVRIDSLTSTRLVGTFSGGFVAARRDFGYPSGGTVTKASFRADGQF